MNIVVAGLPPVISALAVRNPVVLPFRVDRNVARRRVGARTPVDAVVGADEAPGPGDRVLPRKRVRCGVGPAVDIGVVRLDLRPIGLERAAGAKVALSPCCRENRLANDHVRGRRDRSGYVGILVREGNCRDDPCPREAFRDGFHRPQHHAVSVSRRVNM